MSMDKKRIFAMIHDGVKRYVKAKEEGRTYAMNKAKMFLNEGVQYLREVGYDKDADDVQKSVEYIYLN